MACSINLAAQTQYQVPTFGEDPEKEHKAELSTWLLKAYEGDAEAQFRAGVLFADEQFNKPDLEQAIYWFTKAAQQGHAVAQYNLGHYYLNGDGLAKNEEMAMSWWLKAAEQDHALAQFNIGRAYYLGIGMEKDASQSRYWLQRAAGNQEPNSIEILKELGWTSTVRSAPVKSLAVSEPAISSSQEPLNTPSKAVLNSIALFTNPAIRNVLITILPSHEGLQIVGEQEDWLEVQKVDGLPVWVHKDFLQVSGSMATITASNVNARSVPLIAEGTIIGKLKQGENVTVLSQQSTWYRVQSPNYLTAWVKSEDYDRSSIKTQQN